MLIKVKLGNLNIELDFKNVDKFSGILVGSFEKLNWFSLVICKIFKIYL